MQLHWREREKKACLPGVIHKLSGREDIFAGTNSFNCLREETCLLGLIQKLFWGENAFARTIHSVFERKKFCWD